MPEPIPPAPPAPAPAVTFTPEQQAEIDRLVGGARVAGRTSGRSEYQAEVDAYLAEQAESQRIAALQGEEALRAQLAAAETARQQAETAAADAANRATATAALVAAGFNPATLDDALLLLGAGEIAETVPALATRLPALLTPTGTGTPPPPGIIPPAGPPAGGGNQTPEERAAARWSKQHPQAPSAA